jgi:hypothetical protein
MQSKAAVRSQAVVLGAIAIAAIVAVPLLYNYRMSASAWMCSMIAFVGFPFVAGILQDQVYRPVTLAAATLVLMCPIVYVVTDRLAAQIERWRDGYFLAAGAAMIFICASWMVHSARSQRRIARLTAALGLLVSSAAVGVLLWLVVYLE